MKISTLKIGDHNDPSRKKNKIKLNPQNIKNPANDPYDIEEDHEWEEDEYDFIAGLFIFKK
jgi:hypothetical protein